MAILVIDDDTIFSEPLLWQLEQEGFAYKHCQSLDEVIDKKGKLLVPIPKCIILDIMMPRGNVYSAIETGDGRNTGLRLLTDIQKSAPKVPIVIVTVRRDLNIADLNKKYGGAIKDILIKPVAPSQVIEAMKRFSIKG